MDPGEELEKLDLAQGTLRDAVRSTGGEGKLVWSEGRSGYVAVWPLVGRDGTAKGAMVYDVPRDEIEDTLSYLRYGIVALQADSGKELWKFQTGSGVVSVPITWEMDGEQFVGIQSGYGGAVPLWGGDMADLTKQVNQGGSFWVFKLPRRAR